MNKRGVSALIAYVLLVAMGAAASGIVFVGIKEAVEADESLISCPEAVDLSIRDYQCTLDGSFCLTVSNKGRFNASGYIVRVDNQTPRGPDLYVINESGSQILTGEDSFSNYSFNPSGIPYKKEDGEVGNIDLISYVEVQPTRINDRGEIKLCEEVITQQVQCKISGFDCGFSCSADSDCPGGVCINGVCKECRDNSDCPSGFCLNNICVECLQNSDCLSDGNECTAEVCQNNICGENLLVGNPCAGGTGFCAADGTCIPADCTLDSECDTCGAFGANYCISDSIFHNQTCEFGVCTTGVCGVNGTNYITEELVQNCTLTGEICSNGACITPPPVELPWKADVFIIMDNSNSLNYNELLEQIEALSSWISYDLYSASLPFEDNPKIGFVEMGYHMGISPSPYAPRIYDYNSTGTGSQPEWPLVENGYYRPYSNGFKNYLGNPSRIGLKGAVYNHPAAIQHGFGVFWDSVYGAWKFMYPWPFPGDGLGERNIRDGIDIARLVLNDPAQDRPDSEYPDYIILISTGLPRRNTNAIYDTDTCPTVFWASPNNYTCHINEAREAASRAKADGITIYTLALTSNAEDYDTTTTLQQQRNNLTRFLRDDISSGPSYAFENSTDDNHGEELWVALDQIRHNAVTHTSWETF